MILHFSNAKTHNYGNSSKSTTSIRQAQTFLNKLSEELGHKDEKQRTLIILRAVLHTVRDRITIAESFDLMSQLPQFLRGIYSEGWKFSEKPPKRYKTIEEMKSYVKEEQAQLGEEDFNWNLSTAEIIATVLSSLKQYLSKGQMEHIRGQMPLEVQELIPE